MLVLTPFASNLRFPCRKFKTPPRGALTRSSGGKVGRKADRDSGDGGATVVERSKPCFVPGGRLRTGLRTRGENRNRHRTPPSPHSMLDEKRTFRRTGIFGFVGTSVGAYWRMLTSTLSGGCGGEFWRVLSSTLVGPELPTIPHPPMTRNSRHAT